MARKKQCSVIITLLDLKNAFGEVHYNLIKIVLAYHHIPELVQAFIASLYTDFESYINSDNFPTPVIPFKRGVLEGDCLSPLSSTCALIHLSSSLKKYKQLGFSPHDENDRLFHPVQVDKCAVFVIKEFSTSSFHFQPRLLINLEVIPPEKQGESFKYLGRYFNLDMNNKDHKDLALSNLQTMRKAIDSLSIHPKNKLLLYERKILSKLSWHLTVADLGKTWISENLDNIVTKYVRRWLDLPISATLTSIIHLHSKFGQGFQLPSIKFQQCQTTLCSSLNSSCDETVTKLWRNTNCWANIQYNVYKNLKQVLKSICADHTCRLETQLKSQGFIISFILKNSLRKIHSL